MSLYVKLGALAGLVGVKMVLSFFKKKEISSLQPTLPREELIRRSRVLIVDDEEPELIRDLKAAHFSVDYLEDMHRDNMHGIDRSIYDLVLLDFGKVGSNFGSEEGLSLLKHIKRVNPAIIVLTYTSKALGTEHAEFYRLADGVLAKDAGISESMEKIEEGLRKAHSFQHLWPALLKVLDVAPGSKQDKQWQDLLVRSGNKESARKKLKAAVLNAIGSEDVQKMGIGILTRLIDLATHSAA
jgi:DNA-binding NarL/FixJ family response regulator